MVISYPACGNCGHLWSDHYEPNEACGFVNAWSFCRCEEYEAEEA